MKQFEINNKTPDRPRKDVHATTNSQVISDEQIAKHLLLIAQENVEMKGWIRQNKRECRKTTF